MIQETTKQGDVVGMMVIQCNDYPVCELNARDLYPILKTFSESECSRQVYYFCCSLRASVCVCQQKNVDDIMATTTLIQLCCRQPVTSVIDQFGCVYA